jgi:hypothetical protein
MLQPLSVLVLSVAGNFALVTILSKHSASSTLPGSIVVSSSPEQVKQAQKINWDLLIVQDTNSVCRLSTSPIPKEICGLHR